VTLALPRPAAAEAAPPAAAGPHDPDDLRQALRAVEPAAVLVSRHLLNRVIRQVCHPPLALWPAPRRNTFVVDRHVLFRHVEQDELDLGPEQRLPPTVILLAASSPEELAGLGPDIVRLTYWRRLFHASVRLKLERAGDGTLRPEDVRERIAAIGPAEFEEVRQVLTQDGHVFPSADDREVYAAFAAVYLGLRYFAPHLLPGTFPGLGDRERIDRLLARDLDADALFARTRLAGAAEPGTVPGVPAVEADDAYGQLVHAAERAAAAGNQVQAAILRTRAARLAPAALAVGTRAAAEAELRRLAERLRHALQLTEAEAAAWPRDLAALLERADQGRRPAEAALLYDLQNACVDQERELYALGLVESVLSGGRRPVKRPLPCLRPVRTVRHLRAAAQRLPATGLADADRDHLAGLLAAALGQAEERLRARFRPVLHDALHDVGLGPTNPPERVSFDKLIDELLDRVVSYGFLTFGDLRDAVSRSQLKLPDLGSPGQLIRGDELRRLDRRLTVLLDGVYRPGEFYVRWLEGLGALNFGTAAGRTFTRWVTLPFVGAFVLVEALWLALGHVAGVEVPNLVQRDPVRVDPVQLAAILAVSVFFLGLLHVEGVRRGCVRLGRGAYRLARALFVELPARVLRVPAVRRLLTSWPVQLGYWYVLMPAAVCGLLWLALPEIRNGVGALITFVAVTIFLNSRLGAAASAATTRSVLGLYDLLRAGLLPGLYRLIVRAFKRALDAVEYLLFRVDEWLRYRSGDGRWSLAARTVLGAAWFPVSYLARLYAVVFIEPALNPLKLPVCSVAAKFMSAFFWISVASLSVRLEPAVGEYATYGLALLISDKSTVALLAPWLGKSGAWGLAFLILFVTLGLLPNAFGFLFWEMKENWRLYRANRRPGLGPVPVGGHGETVAQLLRPGFHSGTVPRLYARLRRAERRARVGDSWRAVLKCRHALHEVEDEVRRFATRELVALVRQARCWQGSPVRVGRVALALNRIGVELFHAGFPDRPAWLEFEERARWLVGGVREPGWLDGLTAEQRDVFTTALAGLYKLAGVQLVREQLRPNLPAGADYDLAPEGLVLWPERRPGRSLTYDLREGGRQVEPREPDGLRAPGGPVLDADRLVFARVPLLWRRWVESWEQDQAGAGHPRLFDAQMEPVPADPGA
jgi:hypothetical protein